MNTRNPLISVLIYPLAPIAVIYLTHVLCRELWFASFYVPGEDGGEVEPAMAMIGIPFLLIIGALLLGGLTVLKRWGAPRWLTALLRVPLVGMALLLSLIATCSSWASRWRCSAIGRWHPRGWPGLGVRGCLWCSSGIDCVVEARERG